MGGMTSVTRTFVPTYQGLSPADLVRPSASRETCFPFDAPHVAEKKLWHMRAARRVGRNVRTNCRLSLFNEFFRDVNTSQTITTPRQLQRQPPVATRYVEQM